VHRSDKAEEAPASERPRPHIIASLGKGGMGEVYLAAVQGPGGIVKLQVVKLLRFAYAEDEKLAQMFLDEGRLATRLNHPNIVQTNDAYLNGNRLAIQMEHLEGQSLHAVLQRTWPEPMPLALHLHVLRQVLAALDYAHKLTDYDGTPLNIVHRDVAPQNVVVTYDGHTKLVDFGIAKSAQSSSQTSVGVIRGRVPYMSPEQARGEPKLDGRSDVFAVGAMLYRALAGVPLWEGLTSSQILMRLPLGHIPRVLETKPETPAWLAEICDRALAVDREARYRTAGDFQLDLERGMDANALKAGPRELGAYVSKLFSEEKSAERRRIDGALRQLDSGIHIVDASLPSSPREAVPLHAGDTGVDSNASLRVTGGNTRDAPPVPPRRARRGAPLYVYAAFFVAALLAGSALVVPLVSERKGLATKSKVEGTPANASAPAPIDEATVEITIVATPKAATLYLDDIPLASNPFTGTFRRSVALHSLRVEAAGFAPKAQFIQFGASAEIEVGLDPALATSAVAAPSSPTVRPATSPAKREPKFDPSDPWR
jgi:serine/threonine-protein kinase